MILERLPRASHFRQAEADDEEWAAEALEAENDGKAGRPLPVPTMPVAEFTREVELLTLNVELLQVINNTIRTIASDKNAPRPRALPRPLTALDRLKEQQRTARIASLVSEVEEAQERYRIQHAT